MFENATLIESSDLLITKLSDKYYSLQKMRGYYEHEKTGNLHVLAQDREFILEETSNVEFCKDKDDRIYIKYYDRKRGCEMLLKVKRIDEEDKDTIEFLEKVACFTKSQK